MRKITAWAALIAVPTMAVGVYGMSFDVMPETHWKYGYPIVVAVILLACGAVYRIRRRMLVDFRGLAWWSMRPCGTRPSG